MKFHMKRVILWLNNGKRREIVFEPNKVNVITGDSSTGKTEILDIIDYCFLASESKISESIVNENVSWYGLLISINDNVYTVARKSLVEGKVIDEYYFSSEGNIPDKVSANSTEDVIRSILETEFGIDRSVAIPYGSNLIKPGSKISLRYFLMFNTISVNIIENDTGEFFDMQHKARYRDALPRIFDLAVGIETVENVLKKEKKQELENALSKLNRKMKSISKKSSSFQNEQEAIIREAKEYSLIDPELDLESSLAELRSIISGAEAQATGNTENEQLEHDIYLKQRKINNLRRFSTEYAYYKKNLTAVNDSLKPISYLTEKDADIIKTSIFDDVMNSFSSELKLIRAACKGKTPIDNQVNDEVDSLERDLVELRDKLSIRPQVNKNFDNDKSKYVFIGEVKSKMELYSSGDDSLAVSTDKEIASLEEKISSLQIVDTLKKRELTIKLIEEIISEYMEATGSALENYANYKPVFNYQEKSLLLRKPKTASIENVGSSSNHMFMHLFFTLAMHEISFQNKSPFVAPYLVIDQPSRPYYGSGKSRKKNLDHSDESKITKAFSLLNEFIHTRNSNSGDFQIIVFEHIPIQMIEDLDNVHLVAEFYDGNALIPDDLIGGS
jgi:hypothetical protein